MLFPLYDRRTAQVEAELLRLLGIREVPGVNAPDFSPTDPALDSLWFWQIPQPPQELGLSPWRERMMSRSLPRN